MNNRFFYRLKKEFNIAKHIFVPSFVRPQVLKISKSILIILLLCFVVIFASAFIPHKKENKFLSRFKFAQVLQKLMKETNSRVDDKQHLSQFSDLSLEKQTEISNILDLGIMKGYPNGKFYPNKPLRNFEVIHYLKLALGNHEYFVDSLKSIFPLNGNDLDLSSYYKCRLLKNTDKLSDISLKGFVTTLLLANKNKNITGRIVDAVSETSLKNAHLVINSRPVLVDKDGYFKFNNGVSSKSLSFFASAEGYKSINFKQSSSYKKVVCIRLKPEISSAKLEALSSFSNKRIKSFNVSINNKNYSSNEQGIVNLHHLKHGYYNAIFTARGFQVMRKNLSIDIDEKFISVKLFSSL